MKKVKELNENVSVYGLADDKTRKCLTEIVNAFEELGMSTEEIEEEINNVNLKDFFAYVDVNKYIGIL